MPEKAFDTRQPHACPALLLAETSHHSRSAAAFCILLTYAHVRDGLQAGHAIIGALLPEYDPVTKISIIPRGAAGGATFFAPNEEQLDSGLFTKSYLENKMAVALGGRVAEEIILGPDDVTTGASGDFQQVSFDEHTFGCH